MKALQFFDNIDNKEILDKNTNLYIDIKNKKHKSDKKTLGNVQSGVFDRYQLYLENKTRLEDITSIGDFKKCETIMRNSYKNSVDFKKTRKEIFSKMPKGKKSTCPYCLISESNTLDHYFPETDFAEYIIFTPNLVPCCYKCNKTKSSGIRNVIHFYFDNIPQEQFIKVNITFNKDYEPTIEISLENDTPELIINHFTTLDLIKRYKDRCSDELSVKINIFLSASKNGHFESAMDLLSDEIGVLEGIYGRNYWKSCLYRAILLQKKEFERCLAFIITNRVLN